MREGAGTEDQESRYRNLVDTQAELQGTYESFKVDIFQSESYTIGGAQSDSCHTDGNGVTEQKFGLLELTSTNYKVELVWSQYCSVAGIATNIIENMKVMGPTSTIVEGRNYVTAEVKFLRAWAYFDIVRLWDDAPMVLDLVPTITAENLGKQYPMMYPERSATDRIYDQILDGLNGENIIRYLVSKNKGIFQAAKGTTYILRVKMLATRGEKSIRDYTKAVEACDEVIAKSYTLVSNFGEL